MRIFLLLVRLLVMQPMRILCSNGRVRLCLRKNVNCWSSYDSPWLARGRGWHSDVEEDAILLDVCEAVRIASAYFALFAEGVLTCLITFFLFRLLCCAVLEDRLCNHG